MAKRFREYLRPPRKLEFTRDGRWFVGITLMIGFGAINTGNNLLYLLLGMLLGLIIVSGILSERVLSKIEVRRLPTGELFANSPARVAFEIQNNKRWVGSYSIKLKEHESRETRASRRQAIGLPAIVPRKAKVREAENDPGPPTALSLRIPPQSAVVATGETRFPRRGLYQYVGFDITTKFPFGFFEKSKPIWEPREVLVYPEIRSIRDSAVQDDQHLGEVQRQAEGRAGEFFGLREYRDGEDIRDIHWKASARRNQLVKKLYDRRDNEAIALHLYNYIPPRIDDRLYDRAAFDLEEAIVSVASLCSDLARTGHRFSLNTIDENVPEGAGAGQLQAVLRHLALLEIRRDDEPPRLVLSSGKNRLLIPNLTTPQVVVSQFSHVSSRAERNEQPNPAHAQAGAA